MHQRHIGADGREHLQAEHGARMAALARPLPDQRRKAACRLIVAKQAQRYERPLLLVGRTGLQPRKEQVPGELTQ